MKFKTLYIWLSLPFIVIIAWMLAFYMPMSARIKSKEKEIINIRQMAQAIDNDVNNYLILKKKSEETSRLISNLSGDIPLFDQFPDFIMKLAKSTASMGLHLETLDGLNTMADFEKERFLVNPLFEFGLKGKYLSIGKFLEDLTNQKVFNKILKAEIIGNENEYPVLTGKFIIEFKAWKERIKIESK